MMTFTAQDWPYLDDEQRLDLLHSRLSGVICRRAYLEVRKRNGQALPPGVTVTLTKREESGIKNQESGKPSDLNVAPDSCEPAARLILDS